MSGHLSVFRAAWARRKDLECNGSSRPEQAFLPAALEIQERPPSPLGRLLVRMLVALVISAILWAVLGRSDVVAVASGSIIPSGKSKQIQPLAMGQIRAIHVGEGHRVDRGDLLLELDPTESVAELADIEERLETMKADGLRLEALVKGISQWSEQAESPVFPKAITPERVEIQRRLFIQQWNEYVTRQKTLQFRLGKQRLEVDVIRNRIGKLEGVLPLISRRVADLDRLLQRKMVPEHQFLELEQERVTSAHDLLAENNRLLIAETVVRETQSELERHKHSQGREWLVELTGIQRECRHLEQERVKARRHSEERYLRAPVDGTVQQLAVHTVGGVVTPAQTLMKIVPHQAAMEIEALLPNRDKGFVRVGQVAEIKVETFPFTRYGTLQAEITRLSRDAVEDSDLGLVYVLGLKIQESRLSLGDATVELSPGMIVSVEIKTGTRRLIEYFLSPLLRYRDESLRER